MVQGGTDPEASWLGVRMNRPTQYDLRIQRCVVIAGATFSEDHHDETQFLHRGQSGIVLGML
jgi:hypothetical protein